MSDSIFLATPALVPHRRPVSGAQVLSLADAACDAGFDGVSMWTAHHDWAVKDGISSEAFFDYHRERGLSVPATEVILGWDISDPERLEATIHILDVSVRAGASSVIAVTLDPALPSPTEAAAGLAQLCDLAAERGLAISLEFFPFGPIATIAAAARLLDAADRDNLGLVVDTWHWFRQPGGPDMPTLRNLPPERIHILQLNDAPARPADDLINETRTARLLPGEGAIDILRLIDALDEMGAAPTVVLEVFSSSLSALTAADNAVCQYAAAQAVLGRRHASGGPPPDRIT